VADGCVEQLQAGERALLAVLQLNDLGGDVAVQAFERGAVVLLGALQVGGEGGAGLAQGLGSVLKRDLGGVFHVHHARTDLVGADGGLAFGDVDAVRERFHAHGGVGEGGVDAAAGFIDAVGDTLLQRFTGAAQLNHKGCDSGVGLGGGFIGRGGDIAQADIEPERDLVGEFSEIASDGVLQLLVRVSQDAGIGVGAARDRVDVLGVGVQR
jgi:hypothetical protein